MRGDGEEPGDDANGAVGGGLFLPSPLLLICFFLFLLPAADVDDDDCLRDPSPLLLNFCFLFLFPVADVDDDDEDDPLLFVFKAAGEVFFLPCSPLSSDDFLLVAAAFLSREEDSVGVPLF